MAIFNIHLAKAHFSALVQRAMLGEDIIIARNNKPILKLVPLNPVKKQRRLGTAKGLIVISDDFDAPLDDFRNY